MDGGGGVESLCNTLEGCEQCTAARPVERAAVFQGVVEAVMSLLVACVPVWISPAKDVGV